MLDNQSERRVAVVSGGSRGIGRAICIALAAADYDIAYCYARESEAALETQKLCEALGAKVLAARCDVVDSHACEKWIKSVLEECGPVDVLVNNAGVTRDALLIAMSEEDWRDVIDVNMTGMFNVSRPIVFEFMRRRRGVVVNISSVSGVYGNRAQCNYSAAKAGVIGFSKALAKEVGVYGIRVNAIAPGFIQTDMAAAVSASELESVLQRTPLGRFGLVDEVASAVCYLVSDAAKYITGQVIEVSGGLTL